MTIHLGVVMDPITDIKPHKDSTFAMLLEAQQRGWQISYLEISDLSLRNGLSFGNAHSIEVFDQNQNWFQLGACRTMHLGDLDVILMRKDPPFDQEYLYATQLLELAENAGCLVVNRPQSLRDYNEKLVIAHFPKLTPPTLVSCNPPVFRDFLQEQGDIILKPLDAMGGAAIFRLRPEDPNIGVVLEQLTDHGQRHIMAQRYLPEIAQGDKRILMIAGQPVPYALARIPAPGETRGNLAAGGHGVPQPLQKADWHIAETVGPMLREQGVLFAGLDVIGDKLTEINITSPTCIRELDAAYGLNIAGQLFDAIAARLAP